jgi:hypothetical protein
MKLTTMPTSECSGCRRQLYVLCVDCLETLKRQQCVCCGKPVHSPHDPHPLCPTCEKDVAAEEAKFMGGEK